MKVSLLDVDGPSFPNLALMKISAWHKAKGNAVAWYDPLFSHPEILYASKIFSFTPDYWYFPKSTEIIKGGTGYDVKSKLPDEIDAMFPDYSIYPSCDYAIGFLTRGCIRKCPWCVVPVKEGDIAEYRTVEQIIRKDSKKLILMDNNFLAADAGFVREQLTAMQRLRLKVDFNQGLDCRLVNAENAKWLAKTIWLRYVRFSCDTNEQLEPCRRAIRLMREAGYTKEFFVYVLAKEFKDAYDRLGGLLAIDDKVTPFIMPYREWRGEEKHRDENEWEQILRLARWCNRVWIRKSCKFEEYNPKCQH